MRIHLGNENIMKKYKHGMVLGKFYPPHNGHLYLIEEAIKQCYRVTIFLCTQPSESIDADIRYNWMSDIIQKKGWDVTFIHIKDELPQHPDPLDLDNFYDIWCNEVNSRVHDLDVVFTSEKYGDEFAEYLGVEHVLIDLPRLTHSVSVTSIRSNPIENWEHIPDVVKPYFKKKIVIVGPESTGKTILTNKLAKYFGGDIIREYGREFTNNKPATKMNIKDFETIAEIHKSKIDDVITNGDNPLIFIDTEAITTYLFGGLYLGKHNFSSEKIVDIIFDQIFDLILLCDIDVPWVDDGTRDFPNKRKEHLKDIKNALKMFEFDYKIIRGNYDERFELAKKYVKQLT